MCGEHSHGSAVRRLLWFGFIFFIVLLLIALLFRGKLLLSVSCYMVFWEMKRMDSVVLFIIWGPFLRYLQTPIKYIEQKWNGTLFN